MRITRRWRGRGPTDQARGLSIVELLISLAIVAMLLTATMVAIDASFYAYASAAESASTQTTTRLAVHRLNALIRTSTAHGPLLAELPEAGTEEYRVWQLMKNALDLALQSDVSRPMAGWDAETPQVDEEDPDILHSSYLWLRRGEPGDPVVEDYLLVYLRELDELWLVRRREREESEDSEEQAGPLLGGVSQQIHDDALVFSVRRRRMYTQEGDFHYVLERAHVDLKVLPARDASLAVENTRRNEPLRVIASTVPRRLN